MRAWSILSGQLVWEMWFPTFASPPTLDVTPIELHHLKAKMILVFGGLHLYGVSSADGEILWKTNTANARCAQIFLQKGSCCMHVDVREKNQIWVGVKDHHMSRWHVQLEEGFNR